MKKVRGKMNLCNLYKKKKNNLKIKNYNIKKKSIY